MPVVDIGGCGKEPETRKFEVPREWSTRPCDEKDRHQRYDQAKDKAPADSDVLPYELEWAFVGRMAISYPRSSTAKVKEQYQQWRNTPASAIFGPRD